MLIFPIKILNHHYNRGGGGGGGGHPAGLYTDKSLLGASPINNSAQNYQISGLVYIVAQRQRVGPEISPNNPPLAAYGNPVVFTFPQSDYTW